MSTSNEDEFKDLQNIKILASDQEETKINEQAVEMDK